jgi:hypothetical protein
MGFLYKRTDDRDDYAEGPAVIAVGRVLAALLGGERNTKPNPRTEPSNSALATQWPLGSAIGPTPRPDRVSCGEYWERVQAMATLTGILSAALPERLCTLLPPAVHAMT